MTPHEELLSRLALDRRAIEVGGEVVEVRSGLSDPHDGGCTVAIVRFASGLRVGDGLATQGRPRTEGPLRVRLATKSHRQGLRP